MSHKKIVSSELRRIDSIFKYLPVTTDVGENIILGSFIIFKFESFVNLIFMPILIKNFCVYRYISRKKGDYFIFCLLTCIFILIYSLDRFLS